MKKALFTTLAVLFADQALKIWVKTNMYIGQEFNVFGDWFIIHFTENPGMAFGLEFGGDLGKMALSVFRIIAVFVIGYYLFREAKKAEAKTGLIVAGALIFSGAIGNIIDSALYGLIFNDSYHQIAEFMPAEGGYESFLHGRVVDMLYFPLFDGTFPSWVPFWGGQDFLFFRPVFNIADTAISTGIGMIIVFQKRYFPEAKKEEIATTDATEESVSSAD